MEILRTISLYCEAHQMPFLLIGGHAINAYAMQRQTGDIDLIVRRTQKESWQTLFSKIKYVPDQSDDRFIRYRPDTFAAWPIDLMLVDDETFTKLYSDARSVDLGAVTVQVASPRHLITLKIHALKIYQEHRFAKDYNDLIHLLRSSCPELRGDDLKSLCLRYADGSLYDKLLRDLT